MERNIGCAQYIGGAFVKMQKNQTLCNTNSAPAAKYSCNMVECDKERATVILILDTSYADVTFSAEASDTLVKSFIAEMSRYLHLPQNRIFVTGLRSVRGSIEITFDMLPTKHYNIDDIMGNLTSQERAASSPLRTQGTWGPRISSLTSKIFRSTDLCEHVSCSGHGTCFPDYTAASTTGRSRDNVRKHWPHKGKGVCICDVGFKQNAGGAEDCGVAIPGPLYNWKVGPWSFCSKGCGGGTRTRQVHCGQFLNGQLSGEERSGRKCQNLNVPKPAESERCQLLTCGENYARVVLALDLRFSVISFSAKAMSMFVQSFVTEMAGALCISESRLMVSSVVGTTLRSDPDGGQKTLVTFDTLPATSSSSTDVADVLNDLQRQVNNQSSNLRSIGSWGRRVLSDVSEGYLKIATDETQGPHRKISLKFVVFTIGVLVVSISIFAGIALRLQMSCFRGKAPERQDILRQDVELSPMHIE
jgi:hypothetical protein